MTQLLKRMFLFFVCLQLSVSVFAQQSHFVKGVVKDETGEPLIGVTIAVEGTGRGVATDFNGEYSIKVDNAKEVLVFSYIGYKDSKKVAGTSGTINMVMQTESYSLDDVVVIGYGAVRKKELTGAVANISSEDISRVVTADLGTALQGQVAGVSVVSGGAPGSSSEIQIRGISSISGSNTPLYVVDGVPQNGDPRISTNEIQSIDILKDAASCAIYGTRGAAGVILITTKQGKEGTMRISLDASYGIQNIRSQRHLMDANEQSYFELIKSRNVQGAYDDETILDLAKYPTTFLNNTNLSERVFVNNAPIQSYNLNISAGKDGFTYNIAAGYYDQTGVLINSNYDKFNTRINANYKKDRWRLSASAGLQSEVQDQASGALYVQSIKYLPTQNDIDLDSNEPIYSPGGDSGTRLGWVLQSFQNQDNTKRLKAFGNFSANFEILKGLELSTRVGYTQASSYRHQFEPYFEAFDYLGQSLTDPANSGVTMTATTNGALTWDGGVNYNKKVAKHSFTLYAGASMEKYTYNGFFAEKQGVLDNDIYVLNGTSINPSANSLNDYTSTLVGTIGRLQYNWNSRYLFSASVRVDGSSKFAAENRWGVFPSASAAWNIFDEEFMEPLSDVVTNFKLRASYGTTGNQNFAAYSYTPSITNGYDAAFGNGNGGSNLVTGSTQVGYANSNVKWETTIQSNIGVDLSFFDKITLVAEYYDTKKSDMLFPVTLPGTTGNGGGNVIMNIGNMTNSGYEVALGYNDRINDFSWSANATFSTNQNMVTEMFSTGIVPTNDAGLISGMKETSQVVFMKEGYEASSFFLYTTDGIVDTQEKLAAYQQIQPTAKMGDLIYKDNSGNGKIDEADRVYCGSGTPDYELGLNLSANYAGFDLSVLFHAALGHEIMNGADAVAYSFGRHKDLVYCWSEANPITSLPAYRGNSKEHANYRGYTDLWLEDGDYMRVKQITLGYTLPKNVVKDMYLKDARFYVTLQNPFTITGYKGFDPEVGGGVASRGVDRGVYPVSSFYMLGANIKF